MFWFDVWAIEYLWWRQMGWSDAVILAWFAVTEPLRNGECGSSMLMVGGTFWVYLGAEALEWHLCGNSMVLLLWSESHITLSALHLCLILQTMQSCRATQHSEMIWIMLVKASIVFEPSCALVCLKQWYLCVTFIFLLLVLFESLGCLGCPSTRNHDWCEVVECTLDLTIYGVECSEIYGK